VQQDVLPGTLQVVAGAGDGLVRPPKMQSNAQCALLALCIALRRCDLAVRWSVSRSPDAVRDSSNQDSSARRRMPAASVRGESQMAGDRAAYHQKRGGRMKVNWRNEHVWLVVFVCAVAVVSGIHWRFPRQSGGFTPIAQRRSAGDVTLPRLGGGEWKLADHRGQVVLINYWATWCEP